MFNSWKVIKEENKNNKQTGTRKPERPAQQNEIAPNHYIYTDKGFARNKKEHTTVCNASYLYNYIEISHNYLISFFLPLLTTVITVK